MGPGVRIEKLRRLNQLKTMSDDRVEKALDTLGLFKQCVMETLIRKRQEYQQPTLSEVLKQAIEKANEVKEK